MNVTTEKSKPLATVATVLSIIAHVILVLGIIAMFILPLIGLAIAFDAAIVYIFFIALAGIFRHLAKR